VQVTWQEDQPPPIDGGRNGGSGQSGRGRERWRSRHLL
jgi:hypothetical protein